MITKSGREGEEDLGSNDSPAASPSIYLCMSAFWSSLEFGYWRTFYYAHTSTATQIITRITCREMIEGSSLTLQKLLVFKNMTKNSSIFKVRVIIGDCTVL